MMLFIEWVLSWPPQRFWFAMAVFWFAMFCLVMLRCR